MSGVEARIEVFGLGQALKDLNKIDKSLRRDITKDYKRVTAGVVSDIQSAIPLNYPLSGWARKWNLRGSYEVFPWPTEHSVKAYINTKAPKEVFGGKVNLSTFAIKWLGAASAFFDFSNSNAMGAALSAKYGQPSRVVWKAYEANKSELDVEMARIVDRVGEALSRDLSIR